MDYSVPTLSIVFMAISALASIAIPVILFVVFRRIYKADVKPFFVGCATFILFALILKLIAQTIISLSGYVITINSSPWLYGLYGGLMAGLFEETGRLVAFKTVLKKNNGNDNNSLMYGVGHGGIEAFIILSISMVSNLVTSYMINNQMVNQLFSAVAGDPQKTQYLEVTLQTLANTPSEHFLMALVERLAAVAIHIALSVLVWFAAKKGGKSFWLYPLAIALHTLVNAVALVIAHYVTNLWVVEAVIWLISIISILVAILVWKSHKSRESSEIEDLNSIEM